MNWDPLRFSWIFLNLSGFTWIFPDYFPDFPQSFQIFMDFPAFSGIFVAPSPCSLLTGNNWDPPRFFQILLDYFAGLFSWIILLDFPRFPQISLVPTRLRRIGILPYFPGLFSQIFLDFPGLFSQIFPAPSPSSLLTGMNWDPPRFSWIFLYFPRFPQFPPSWDKLGSWKSQHP